MVTGAAIDGAAAAGGEGGITTTDPALDDAAVEGTDGDTTDDDGEGLPIQCTTQPSSN